MHFLTFVILDTVQLYCSDWVRNCILYDEIFASNSSESYLTLFQCLVLISSLIVYQF